MCKQINNVGFTVICICKQNLFLIKKIVNIPKMSVPVSSFREFQMVRCLDKIKFSDKNVTKSYIQKKEPLNKMLEKFENHEKHLKNILKKWRDYKTRIFFVVLITLINFHILFLKKFF